MIKIIKHGKTIQNKVCDNCNCEFEFASIDVRSGITEFWIDCPECGYANLVWDDEEEE